VLFLDMIGELRGAPSCHAAQGECTPGRHDDSKKQRR
jgi:hypothetical protein